MSQLMEELLKNNQLRRKEHVLTIAQEAEPMEPWATG